MVEVFVGFHLVFRRFRRLRLRASEHRRSSTRNAMISASLTLKIETLQAKNGRTRHGLVFFALAGFLAGCAYPNQFRNVSINSPHSVLVADHVKVGAINGQPTSFWRSNEHFRIPPGRTTVNPISGVWKFPDYPGIEFNATAGCRYVLRHQATNDCHMVFVWERPPGASDERVVGQVEAKRQKSND